MKSFIEMCTRLAAFLLLAYIWRSTLLDKFQNYLPTKPFLLERGNILRSICKVKKVTSGYGVWKGRIIEGLLSLEGENSDCGAIIMPMLLTVADSGHRPNA